MRAVSVCSTKPASPKLQTNPLQVMSVSVGKNVHLFGLHLNQMAPLYSESQSMGDMEMIDQHGVKAKFTDNGVQLEIVKWSDRCIACNDPRLMREGNTKVCVCCGCRQ